MCAATENLAFFASVVADSTKLRLPGAVVTQPPNRSRNYVTFQTNEGDVSLAHSHWLTGSLLLAHWLSPIVSLALSHWLTGSLALAHSQCLTGSLAHSQCLTD